MRPDKAKVVDEVFDDERIRSFLDKAPLGAEPSADFSALLYAYRSMRAEDFARFTEFFVADGRDLSAANRQGQTVAEVIAGHRHATDFLEVLKQHGAA